MNNVAQEIIELQKGIERDTQRKNEAKGALQQVLRQIKDEFKTPSLKEAKQQLIKMGKQKTVEEQKRDKLLKDFKAKWEDSDE